MITFYAPKDPYGFFSSFSRHEVTVFGQTWPTSEHPFQAMKYSPHRPDLVAKIGAKVKPSEAAFIGRNTSLPLRPDWERHPGPLLARIKGADVPPEPGRFHHQDDGINRMGVTAEPILHRVKDVIMYEVVFAKFTQHADLRAELLTTRDQVLVEDALHDPYWGWGASRIGENKLGRILMAVRSAIRSKTGEGVPVFTT